MNTRKRMALTLSALIMSGCSIGKEITVVNGEQGPCESKKVSMAIKKTYCDYNLGLFLLPSESLNLEIRTTDYSKEELVDFESHGVVINHSSEKHGSIGVTISDRKQLTHILSKKFVQRVDLQAKRINRK